MEENKRFPCWRWCSSVLRRTNAQRIFQNICLGHLFSTYVSYDWLFSPSPIFAHVYAFRVTSFCVVISLILCSSLPFLLCSFVIVSSYCFTSEIQGLIFLSQALTTSWHSISSSMSMPRRATLGKLPPWLLRFLQKI